MPTQEDDSINKEIFERVRSMAYDEIIRYQNDELGEYIYYGFTEALRLVNIELFGNPKSQAQGFLKEQITLAEQSLVEKQIKNINKFMPELRLLNRDVVIELLSINNKEK